MIFETLQKNLIKSTLKYLLNNNGCKIIFSDDKSNWSKPIPNDLPEILVIDIINWTLENTKVEDEYLYLTTAFGREEYSKFFHFNEILSIVDLDGKLLYNKIMELEETQYTLYNLIKD